MSTGAWCQAVGNGDRVKGARNQAQDGALCLRTPTSTSARLVCLYSTAYHARMYTVETTQVFDDWLGGLRDSQTRLRLRRRLDKAQRGLLGDVAPVGQGVFGMRELFGPGWRMYDLQQGSVLIVMLGGGDKATQQADIAAAAELALLFKE